MKKPLKTAAICGIIMLSVSFLLGIISAVYAMIALAGSDLSGFDSSNFMMGEEFRALYLLSAIVSIAIIPLSIIFFNGFVSLGKRFKNKPLYLVSFLIIILTVISGVLILISIFTGNIYPKPQPDINQDNFTFSSIANIVKQSIVESSVYAPIFMVIGDSNVVFWLFIILTIIISFALYITLGISILNLKKDNVPLAGVTGIFYILLPFWAVFGLVANILAIIMFFKSSRKYESGKIVKEKTR